MDKKPFGFLDIRGEKNKLEDIRGFMEYATIYLVDFL